MFEQYHLMTLDLSHMTAQTDMGAMAKEWSRQEKAEFEDWTKEQAQQFMREFGAMDTDFVLSGHFEVLPPTLPLKPDSDELVYCQSFSILTTGPTYYTKRWDYPSHLLLYTLDGEGTLKYGDNEYVLAPGQGFLIDCKNEQEYFTSGNSWHHLDFHFHGGNSGEFYRQITQGGTAPLFSFPSTDQFCRLLEPFLDAYTTPSQNKPFYVHEAITTFLTKLLHETEKQSGQVVPVEFQTLIQKMEALFKEDLSLDDMAKAVNLSKYHFAREFKRYLGVSPHEYLISIRLINASLLLKQSPLSVAQVGEAVGIPNTTNFTRLFKKRFGVTPGKYRKA